MRELSNRVSEILNSRRTRRNTQQTAAVPLNQNVTSSSQLDTASLGLLTGSAAATVLVTSPLPPPPPPVSATTHHHHNHHSSSSSRYERNLLFKKNERNFLSAFCSIFCIAVLTVSLAETRWFYLNGGGCNVNYLGVSYFFASGHLETKVEPSRVTKYDMTVNNFLLPNGMVLKNCANKDILIIMRLMIAFIFLAIISSFIGLIIDSFGFMKSGIKLIRRHAIFHITTVVLCLIINGFCFWVTERINDQQYLTRFKKGKKIDVQFDVSYYLIVFASILSILATAFTLIKRYPTDEDEQLDRLLEEYTGFEDPINLERSLPAIVNTNNCTRNNHVILQASTIPLPPPPTPPLSLHNQTHIANRLNGYSQSPPPPLNELPPPYMDDNNSDTVPLIN